jgi:hypothetical protein
MFPKQGIRSGQYLWDVLKWGFSIAESSPKFGIFFCDGQVIQRVPPEKLETFLTGDGYPEAGVPFVGHPVQEPLYDTQLSWEDYPLSVFDFSASQWFLSYIFVSKFER